jgi:tryptophanase
MDPNWYSGLSKKMQIKLMADYRLMHENPEERKKRKQEYTEQKIAQITARLKDEKNTR